MDQAHLGISMLIDLSQVSHVLENRPVNPSVTNPLADEPFERAVSALRLLGPGGVAFDFVGTSFAYLKEGRITRQKPSTGAWSGRKVLPEPEAPFFLERKNRRALLRIHTQISHRMSKRVIAALTRFNFAYERKRSADRLIDYWIALEGLFSPDDQRELAYRMGLRIAFFLQNDGNLRDRTYKLMLDSYNLRSRYVHGSEPSDLSQRLKLAPETLISETEGALRNCLVKLLDKGPSFNIDSIEGWITKGEPK
jgi:hypothetical protein